MYYFYKMNHIKLLKVIVLRRHFKCSQALLFELYWRWRDANIRIWYTVYLRYNIISELSILKLVQPNDRLSWYPNTDFLISKIVKNWMPWPDRDSNRYKELGPPQSGEAHFTTVSKFYSRSLGSKLVACFEILAYE